MAKPVVTIASQATLAALFLSLALPLWASPLATLNGASKWFIDALVAICPASYLASVAGIDYLRSDWMYQHAPYGSLRFDYPDPVHATVVIILLAAIFSARALSRLTGPGPGQILADSPQLLEVNS